MAVNMDKKRLIELIASIFVAVAFISSYVSFANINGSRGATSATTSATGFGAYAFAFYSANIIGYGNALGISVECSNKTLSNESYGYVSNSLNALEKNNSVFDFYPVNNGYSVENGSMGILDLYRSLSSVSNTTIGNCLKFTSSAMVSLPYIMNFTIASQQYTLRIPYNMFEYTVPLLLPPPNNNTLRLKVSALVAPNGTIYSINVTKAG